MTGYDSCPAGLSADVNVTKAEDDAYAEETNSTPLVRGGVRQTKAT